MRLYKFYIDNIKSNDPDELYFTPPSIIYEDELTIKITGSLEHIWGSPDNKSLETLVISTSNKFSYKNIIPSFLFYIILKLDKSGPLYDLMKDKNFIINVSHGKGVSKLTYNFTNEECRNYFYPLVKEMITVKSFDFLPFQIVMENKILKPIDTKSNADQEEKNKYKDQLIGLINFELEKHITFLNQSDLLKLLPIKIPEDAYDKVFKRYNFFTKHQEEI